MRTKKSPPVATTGTPDVIRINLHCKIRKAGDRHIVVVHGIPMAKFTLGDRLGEALVMVNLVVLGHATEREAAEAFGWSVQDVGRVVLAHLGGGSTAVRDFVEGGTFPC